MLRLINLYRFILGTMKKNKVDKLSLVGGVWEEIESRIEGLGGFKG